MSKIRIKQTFIIFMAILLPCLSTWYILHKESYEKVQQQAERRLVLATEKQIFTINEWIDSTTLGMKLAADTYSHLEQNTVNGQIVTKSFVNNYPWLIASFITDAKGKQISRNNDEMLSDISDREYFKSAVQGVITTQIGISKANKEPVLLSAAPIKNKHGEYVGVLGFSAELMSISKTILDDKIGQTGYSFVFDKTGRLIAHPSKTKTDLLKSNKGEDYNRHPIAAKYQKITPFSENGKDWIGYSDKTKNGWTVGTIIEKDESLQALITIDQKDYVILFFIFTGCLVISVMAGQINTKKTRELHSIIMSIKNGEDRLSELEDFCSNDEVEDIADIHCETLIGNIQSKKNDDTF